MKATLTNITKRIRIKKVRTAHIMSYDEDNCYPQRVQNIVSGSGVATACINMYVKFMLGGGFEDKTLFKSVINRRGLTVDKLGRKVCKQFANFNGVAVQVNYNALYQKTEINFVPFPYCRLTDSEDIKYANKCAIYDDWDRCKKSTIDIKNIQFVDFYNPDPVIIQAQVDAAGGWDKYKGQIYYWTADGIEYPLALFDSILEDIQTDGEVKLFKFRNITTNFMASHLLLTPPVEDSSDGEGTGAEETGDDWKQTIEDFQGADNTAKILHIETTNPEAFKLLKVEIQNIENLFSYTESSVKENIIRQFNIPPVLMGILQAGKLGTAKEIQDATEYFNGVTAPERLIIEEIFTELFTDFVTPINPTGNYQIIPYKNPVMDTTIEAEFAAYFTPNEIRINKGHDPIKGGDMQYIIDTIGMKGVTAVAAILTDTLLTPDQKANAMVELLGISIESATKMAGTTVKQP